MLGKTQAVPVAVVGAGNMGRHHARVYASLPGVDLRAVVDSDLERAARVAARHGARPYGSVEEALAAEPDLAAASVATPTTTHHEVAVTLLEGGIDVLVEKPVAATLAEADALVGLAHETGRVLAVGHVERFNPAVRELKKRIESGEIGTLLSLVARRVGVMPPQVTDANVVLDLAIHDIDVLRWLLDAELPDELACHAGRANGTPQLDFADIFLRFGNVACLVEANWLTPVKIRSLAVTGTRAYAELRYATRELDLYRAQAVREADSFADVQAYSEQAPERPALERTEPLELELAGFVNASRGLDGEIVRGEEGRRSMEIAVAVAEHVESRLELV